MIGFVFFSPTFHSNIRIKIVLFFKTAMRYVRSILILLMLLPCENGFKTEMPQKNLHFNCFYAISYGKRNLSLAGIITL